MRLGQNFLADPNLLDAIVRDAELRPGDVALEIGAGEGVLSRRLTEAVAHLHLIEIDRGLEPLLRDLGAREDVGLVWADAMKLDLGSLGPPPNVMVANLPYSVAAPLILRTTFELPGMERWTVMVQREIADRLRAGPGSKAYGAPSVLVQQSCEVRVIRPVDPAVFRPRPRVGSAVIGLRRIAPPPSRNLREVVHSAFAHRRKSLARSIELRHPGTLTASRSGLERLGLATGIRAEALAPGQLAALAEMIQLRND